MSAHLSAWELSQMVQGEGDLGQWDPHVDGCARCAAAVQREARLELTVRALFREQRCGTSALEGAALPTESRSELRPAVSSRSWRMLAGCAVLSLLLAWIPAMAPEPAAGTDLPCAGVVVDGGAPLLIAAVGDGETFSAHGTP